MNLLDWAGPLPYLAVFAATVVEGEVVFIAAAVLAQSGQLEPAGVLLAGALGGSAGDQAYFYVIRFQAKRRFDRRAVIGSRRERLLCAVARHATAVILACRFLPGLRIAIPVTCGLSDVSAWRFSILSLLSSLVWAAGIVGVVSWMGPAALARLGVGGAWAAAGPALFIFGVSWVLTRRARDRLGA